MNRTQSMFPRRLTTSAQVHPRFLPYMHQRGSFLAAPALRRLPAYAAVACAGYAVAIYVNNRPEPATNPKDSHLSGEGLALLDAYGGRESLEELEKAAMVYSSQQTRKN